MFGSTLSPAGTDLSVDSDFAACLLLQGLDFTAFEGEPSRPVSSNRASPTSTRSISCASTKDGVEVDFAFPVGFFGFESDVDLIGADFSTR